MTGGFLIMLTFSAIPTILVLALLIVLAMPARQSMASYVASQIKAIKVEDTLFDKPGAYLKAREANVLDPVAYANLAFGNVVTVGRWWHLRMRLSFALREIANRIGRGRLALVAAIGLYLVLHIVGALVQAHIVTAGNRAAPAAAPKWEAPASLRDGGTSL